MDNATALAPINSAAVLMPAMSVEQAVQRYKQFKQFVSELMIEDSDFGTIPGTNKPTLLKPGAEKLTTFFGLTKRFEIIEREEDWTGERHGGEAFFNYIYRCSLFHGSTLIAESDGSCNSWESKYRWRKAERVCPSCGAATIIKGKPEFGGGWLCFAKKGGCGAKFPTGSEEIESQQVGRIPNPDIFDQINTFQKMASKRALVAATLLAVNASEFFTQDTEDFPASEGNYDEPRQPRASNAGNGGNGQAVKKGDSGKLQQPASSPEEERANAALIEYCAKQKGTKNDAHLAYFKAVYGSKSAEFRINEARKLGLTTAPAVEQAPAPVEPGVIDGDFSEIDPKEALLIEIQELIEATKAAPLNRTTGEINAEIKRQMGHAEIGEMNAEALATLKEGLTIWIQQLRKK